MSTLSLTYAFIGLLIFVLLSGIRIAQEYQGSIVFRLGRFAGLRGPGNGTLQKMVDSATEPWGIKIEMVEMKDVEIPEVMQMLSEIGIDNKTTTIVLVPSDFTNAAKSFSALVQKKSLT